MSKLVAAIAVVFLLGGCSGLIEKEGVAAGTGATKRTTPLAQNTFANSDLLAFSVPDSAVSATFMADGGTGESDMDISYLQGPDGYTFVTESWSDADLGWGAQNLGGSTVALTIPNGNYTYSVGGTWFGKYGCQTCAAPGMRGFYKLEYGTVIYVNLILVSQSDITSTSDAALQTFVNEFKRIFALSGFDVRIANYFTFASTDTLVSDTDDDGNGQRDAMDRLFASSAGQQDGFLNIYLVSQIGNGGGVLGIAGGIPGPPVAGTPHSGVIVSSFGGLTTISNAFLKVQANTAAHESAHYLGLFHTTNSSGTSFDPITDTPQCDAANDSNTDGKMTAEECSGLGGSNLMFWIAPATETILQEYLSPGQQYILQLSASTFAR